jgi:hypothetical protein
MSVHEDRRDTRTQRIPFEAIVEIGTQGDTPAFEAQGVDLSAGGMHLRTAYLPELGHPLLCRFDAPGDEVIAEGNVVWRREAGRGGEFGLRFTRLEGNGARMLVDMCGAPAEASANASTGGSDAGVDPGARVRLHIDGLGSPMRARVRGVAPGELMVGSNLEFLRVGRALDLEDMDRGGQKRPAHIERVDVEIDPATHVPQLVVTLRYDDPKVGRESETGGREITPQPTTIDASADGKEASFDPGDGTNQRASRASFASISPDQGSRASFPAAQPTHDDEVEAAMQMRSKLSKMAVGVGPKLERFGAQAKTALAILRGKLAARAGAGADEEGAPRRTTAPAPGGVLHAQGKRVVREDRASMPDRAVGDSSPVLGSKLKKRVAMGGAAAGVALVIGLVAMRQPAAPPPGAEADGPAADALSAKAAPAAAAVAAPAAAGTITANVPLFGPTTVSAGDPPSATPVAPFTTSLGATPAAPSASTPGEGSASSSSASTPAFEDAKRRGSDRDDDEVRAIVHGKVVHPIVLRLKTDGEITELHGGASAASGALTITVPGRRIGDSGADLTARDERLRAVHVSNGAKGAQIVLRFRDGVPPYAVRARGHEVQISLGRDDKPEAAARSATAAASAAARVSPSSPAPHGTVAKHDPNDRPGHRD